MVGVDAAESRTLRRAETAHRAHEAYRSAGRPLAEHCYLTEKANEERKKRPDYRAIIEYDGLPRQESSNMVNTQQECTVV